MGIIITGAGGRLARLAAEHIQESVPASELILATRNPQALQEWAGKGAQVRRGDFEVPESLPAAFAGGSRMLLIGTHGRMERVAMHAGVIDAAARAGVGHVVFLSFCNPVPGNPMFVSDSNRQIEEHLKKSGLAWTILYDFIYTDLRLDIAPHYLKTGKIRTNITKGAHAYVWREDCAATAAAVLAGSGHEGKSYDVTGPELSTVEEYRDLLVEFGGRDVEIEYLSDEEHARYGAAFQREFALPTWMPELHTSTGVAIREGYMSGISSAVRDVTGKPPRTMREMFELRRDDLRLGRPVA